MKVEVGGRFTVYSWKITMPDGMEAEDIFFFSHLNEREREREREWVQHSTLPKPSSETVS